MNRFWKKYLSTLFFGLLIAFGGILIARSWLPDGAFHIDPDHVCKAGEFARRWDGSCHGWNKELATANVIGSLKHWVAYCVMAFVVAVRHPIIKRDWVSHVTVYLTAAFIFGCGITHLIDAYTVFNPVYIFQTDFLNWNGNISLLSMPFVIYGLLRSVKIAVERKRKLMGK